MNVSDSELVESILIKKGYKAINDPDNADVLFVNTCSIREHAEDKVHSLLGRYNVLKSKKPDMIIGVLGCMAQSLKHDILENKGILNNLISEHIFTHLKNNGIENHFIIENLGALIFNARRAKENYLIDDVKSLQEVTIEIVKELKLKDYNKSGS